MADLEEDECQDGRLALGKFKIRSSSNLTMLHGTQDRDMNESRGEQDDGQSQ